MPEEPESRFDSYVQNSAFVRLFGKPSRAKILDVFLRKHNSKLTASEISELAGVSRSTISRNLDSFLSLGIIEESGKEGGAHLYSLNKEDELVKPLGKIHRQLLSNVEFVPGKEEGEEERGDIEDPRIVIVGAGGAGINTVNRLYNIGVEGADTVAIDTDKQHLKMVEADTKILVGKSLTNGLSAGGDPSMGERATEMAQGTIKEVLGDADLVFVTAGMGGGTGTGAAPVVSKIAKEQGAIVVGMVSTPFNVERARTVRAQEGLQSLHEETDTMVVLDANCLLRYAPNLSIGKAFSVMDQFIAETVKGISETITQPSLINLDYADMTAIMNQGGIGVMLAGEARDETNEVVNNALSHPFLDVDYADADGGLVHITGGPDFTLNEAEGIAHDIVEQMGDEASIIWGAQTDDRYEGKVRVLAILTGVEFPQILEHHNIEDVENTENVLESISENLRGDQPNGEFANNRSPAETDDDIDVFR